MYGVAITPALIAALAWKRATRAGGLASILSGAFMALVLELVIPNAFPELLKGGDPWGIPSIYPAALVSIGALFIVSLLTKPPSAEELAPLFGKPGDASAAVWAAGKQPKPAEPKAEAPSESAT
jgi:SSS family solute:Na+ symporter